MIVKHETPDKFSAGRLLQLAKAIQVFGPQRGGCLDLDASDTATAVFNDDVHFLALACPEVRQAMILVAPRHQLQYRAFSKVFSATKNKEFLP